MFKNAPNKSVSAYTAPKIDPQMKKINEQKNVLGNVFKDLDDDDDDNIDIKYAHS
jgi:hypothetical protein